VEELDDKTLAVHCPMTGTEEVFTHENEFVKRIRDEAAARGIDLEKLRNKYTMRLDLA